MESERPASDEHAEVPEASAYLTLTGTALAGSSELTARAYVALGSNIGDREAALQSAVAELRRVAGVTRVLASPVYEAEAHVLPDQAPQPAFLNAVVAVDTSLSPADLLTVLLNVERAMGRRRDGGRWTARTIDLDLVLYGDRVVHEAGLTVPHPRLAERRFVLAPLADLAADVEVPGTGRSVRDLLETCPDTARLQRIDLRIG